MNYKIGQELTVVTDNLGSYGFSHHVVVKVNKNSIVLDDGRTFLQSGKLRGAGKESWRKVPYLISREDGLQRERETLRAKKLLNLLPEYRTRWESLNARYCQWLPEMREKAREFVAWLDSLDLE